MKMYGIKAKAMLRGKLCKFKCTEKKTIGKNQLPKFPLQEF